MHADQGERDGLQHGTDDQEYPGAVRNQHDLPRKNRVHGQVGVAISMYLLKIQVRLNSLFITMDLRTNSCQIFSSALGQAIWLIMHSYQNLPISLQATRCPVLHNADSVPQRILPSISS